MSFFAVYGLFSRGDLSRSEVNELKELHGSIFADAYPLTTVSPF